MKTSVKRVPVGRPALLRAIEAGGGVTRLAALIGVKRQLIHCWLGNKRAFACPPEYAPLVESATGVTVEELCPQIAWHVVRGRRRRRQVEEIAA